MVRRSQLLRAVIAAAATSIVLVACTSGSSGGAGSVTVGMASSASLGTFLTGPSGKTLYTHAGDSATTSTCTGSCLTAWPPLTVTAGQQPAGGSGVTGQLGTFSRSDGSVQVTYNGLPLYYWQGDAKPGDAAGQGVGGFSMAQATSGAPKPSKSSGGHGY